MAMYSIAIKNLNATISDNSNVMAIDALGEVSAEMKIDVPFSFVEEVSAVELV